MRAIVIARHGGPEVLEIAQLPDPVPGPDEVLVRTRATALNRADLLQRRGLYPAPPGVPANIPGLEFAGEVVQCGNRVIGPQPGDRVMGLLGGGGYAEAIAVHERLCLPVPPALSWVEAAAVPEAFLTAHDALFTRARLAAGEVLLIQAASSGVGTAAAQLAHVAGALVIGSSRTAAKRARLRDLGLSHVLDLSVPDPVAAIRHVAPDGVDVVLDLVGAASLRCNVEVLRTHGRMVIIGLMGGARAELDLAEVLRKRLTITGSLLRSRPHEEKVSLVREFARLGLPLLAAGRVRPVVGRTLELGQAAEAHRQMERNENFGKIVLTVEGAAG